ncbi:MAG: sugar transferase [candidate division KSB1 bacterium]|nr:sugar transferase [candidate division KSB1 bacterium]MDZ7276088.1 sugar transferase [candidate division KSB1 bacterium]MDZ7287132.1 sugar transferase [candidate division KSB1 bacterium]MDZ7296943.1 sugar transferase [candidate division KSB1 bacterium]MDZ7307166.1 sugar transferase [candidate division KSB1 bacterium]
MLRLIKRAPHKYLLALLDWVSINTAFLLALAYGADSQLHSPAAVWDAYRPEILFCALYGAVVVLIFRHYDLYKINVFLSLADHVVRIGNGIFAAVLGLTLFSFIKNAQVIIVSRFAPFSFILISFSLLVFTRIVLFRSLFLFLTKHDLYRRRALILGGRTTGRMMAATVRLKNPYGLRVAGFLDDELAPGTRVFEQLRVLGRLDEVQDVVHRHRIDEILVCLDEVAPQRLLDVLDWCGQTTATVKIASPLYEVVAERLSTERYGNIPVVGFSAAKPTRLHKLCKRTLDVTLATAGLILLAPVMMLIAIAIKLDSPGPVLFRQIRMGKDGRPFHFYKFRSMVTGSDDDDTRKRAMLQFMRGRSHNNGHNGMTKIVNEARITRVGRFIRKTSLDELPQLFNVIKGDMSLVGPRPCLPYEWENYEDWHKKRLSVTPGCTGVWQVSGRSLVGFDDMVILDLYYIQNASLLLDLPLILKTIPVMLFGKGAK